MMFEYNQTIQKSHWEYGKHGIWNDACFKYTKMRVVIVAQDIWLDVGHCQGCLSSVLDGACGDV